MNKFFGVLFITCMAILFLIPNANALSSSAPAVTNTVIDVGQNTVINTIISGGVVGYTSNWFWIAPASTGLTNGNTLPVTISNTIPANVQVIVSPFSSTKLNLVTSNTATFTNTVVAAGTNLITGVWTFNTFAIDANGLVTTNTVNSIATSITINPAFSLTANTVANAIADQGQVETLTISISGGTAPYTYNFLVTNTAALGGGTNIIFSSIISNAVTTNTVSFTIPSTATNANALGTLTFTSNVVDSATTNALTAIGTNTFTVHTKPAVTITSTNALADSSQTQTLRAVESGGTGTLTVAFFNVTGGATFNTVTGTSVGATTTNSFILSSPASGNVFSWNIILTDTGTTSSFVVNSVTNTFTVNSLPKVTLVSTNALADSGQTQTLKAIESGGTGPFTIAFFNVTGGTTFNTVTGTLIAATTTNSFILSSPTNGNVFSWNIILTDTGSSSSLVTNSVTNTFTVNAALAATSIISSNILIDQGQTENVLFTISGGTAPYFYNVMVSNTATGNIIAQNIGGSTAATTNALVFAMPLSATNPNAIGSITISGNVVDSGATASTVKITNTIGVNTLLGVPTTTQPANAVSVGLSIAITATLPAGQFGTAPYTYNWLIYNSISGMSSNALYTGINAASNTYAFGGNSTAVNNYFTINVLVTDSATTKASANSINNVPIVVLSSGGGGCCGGGGGGGGIPPPTSLSTSTSTTTTQTVTTTVTSPTNTIVKGNASSSSPVTVNFTNAGAIIQVYGGSSSAVSLSVLVKNVTGSSPTAPSGTTTLVVLNISVDKTAAVGYIRITISYPAGINASRIAPYLFKNGAWKPIANYTVNAATRTISITSPVDLLVGVFQAAPVATTTQSTVVYTTIATSVAPAPNAAPPSGSIWLWIVAAVVILVVIIWALMRRRSKK